ncbi:FAD-dependent oxidoreductase, partial [Escherichia coli]
MSDSVFDFVVIGGGVAGASIAWSLSAHGRVALLEREAHAG